MPRSRTAKPAPTTNDAPIATTKAEAAQLPASSAEDEDMASVLARASGSTNSAFTNALLSDVAALAPLPPDHGTVARLGVVPFWR